MTQVKDKTDQQLNRALAELMGWRVIQSHTAETGGGSPYYQLVAPGYGGRHYREPEDTWKSVPDYCTDPAASLEVQAKAIADNKLIYLNALLSLVSPGEDIQFGLGGSMEVVGYNIDGTSAMLTASPRERAEAAYITLSISKEDLNGTVGYR
ncbi:hypothetical protein BSK59_08440 [Paenibacillus odorifer]|uniref:hypothetical protein n=1 Tax=Paenibacillus TaxID=44249 RepID=UPI00096FD05E|nr:hypothetical protein [Paenibacillus odorifer]OME58202.1 hypothetical protein BSK59_08440 [Paenibacillus odorifer]